MRYQALFCILASLIVIVISTKSPGPLFMWSDREIFISSQSKIGYAKSEAVEELMENIAAISNKKGSLNKYLSKESPFPEVIAIFLKPHLTNSKFSSWANVYDQKDKNGGSLANVKNLFENSKSSLAIHYSYLKEFFASDILSTFNVKLSKAYPKSSSFLFSNNKQDERHFPLVNENWVSLSKAEEFLVSAEGKKIMQNGEPDLLVFYLSAEETKEVVTAEDSIIGSVSNILNIASNHNYLAIFTADVPEEHNYPSLHKESTVRYELIRKIDTSTNSTIAGTFFPPSMWEAIFGSFIIIVGMSVGISCIMSLQNPPKLLDEAMAKKKKN